MGISYHHQKHRHRVSAVISDQWFILLTRFQIKDTWNINFIDVSSLVIPYLDSSILARQMFLAFVRHSSLYKDLIFNSPALAEGHEAKDRLQWTMTGISLPPKPNSSPKKKKFKLSKRFRSLLSESKRRVIVYMNGQHTNSHEVITDCKSMEDVSFSLAFLFSYYISW